MGQPGEPERGGLDPETRRRLREVFGGKRCTRCGAAAERMCGDRFYCPAHFRGRRADAEAGRRVYRSEAAE